MAFEHISNHVGKDESEVQMQALCVGVGPKKDYLSLWISLKLPDSQHMKY